MFLVLSLPWTTHLAAQAARLIWRPPVANSRPCGGWVTAATLLRALHGPLPHDDGGWARSRLGKGCRRLGTGGRAARILHQVRVPSSIMIVNVCVMCLDICRVSPADCRRAIATDTNCRPRESGRDETHVEYFQESIACQLAATAVGVAPDMDEGSAPLPFSCASGFACSRGADQRSMALAT